MTSTYSATTAADFSFNETKYQPYQFQYQEQEKLQQRHQEEEECYAQYDLEVAHAVAEADYEDYYYEYHYQDDQDDTMDEYEDYQQQNEPYDYRNDSLLSLVVGVQNYLTEQAETSSKCDSPLYNLQYKMYTYMRQRAIELGVQF
ncbi:hypothetical protein [Parasitella parasitica]|uniref:Uncharacterized protein n=1 Tax=Parasitella parasitica TaxID=35722 RepID=A0A0B7NRW9_9FUNG|nr:hypothetical protein [Parasitella parasitica]